MTNILDIRQKETLQAAISHLNKYGKCAILRPTGFGKTTLVCRIIVNNNYSNVLYIYPSESVKEAALKAIDKFNGDKNKIKFISYSKLSRDNGELDEDYTTETNKYDLIVFDEMHHMGASQAKISIENLLNHVNTKITHLIGITATPLRMDGFDIIDNFFDNFVVPFYGIDNAIEDKLLPKPYYVYAYLGVKETEFIKKNGVGKLSDLLYNHLKVDLRTLEGQLSRLQNAKVIIQSGVKKACRKIPSYMKFIVFCPDIARLTLKLPEVVGWFTEAFPEYHVNAEVVHSKSTKFSDIEKLNALRPEPNKIDLIFNVNMLNEGIHMDHITGIVMLRPTKSSAIYVQQFGRCLAVGSTDTPIVFDFVDNVSTADIFKSTRPNSLSEPTKSNITDQLEKLNQISRENVYIIDQVKEVKQIYEKIERLVPTSKEQEMLDARINMSAPASHIAAIGGIQVWEALKFLDKYDNILRPLGLQRQEADYWEKGDINGENRGNKRLDISKPAS